MLHHEISLRNFVEVFSKSFENAFCNTFESVKTDFPESQGAFEFDSGKFFYKNFWKVPLVFGFSGQGSKIEQIDYITYNVSTHGWGLL